MVLDQTANFVRGTVSASIASGDTTINVTDASIYPDPSNGDYNLVLWDTNQGRPDQDSAVEIVRVTGRDTGADTLTVTRGQEGTSAASHPGSSALLLDATDKLLSDTDTALESVAAFSGGTADNLTAQLGTSSNRQDAYVGALDGQSVNNVKYASAHSGATGEDKIQNAIDAANAEAGPNVVVVNGAGPDDVSGSTGSVSDSTRAQNAWALSNHLSVPSWTTIIVQNAYIFLSDGSDDNLVRNADFTNGNEFISIIGDGNSVFDGNFANQTNQDKTTSSARLGLGLRFYQVDSLTLRGFKVRRTEAWAIKAEDVTNLDADDIEFEQGTNTNYTNRDGIHVVGPAQQVDITGMHGQTYDDMVAVGANEPDPFAYADGSGGDVSNVNIDNVTAELEHAHSVRVFEGDGGHRVEEVNITNISHENTGTSGGAVILGDGNDVDDATKFTGITVSNVVSNACPALEVASACRNVTVSDITARQATRVIEFVHGVNSNLGNFKSNCGGWSINGVTAEEVQYIIDYTAAGGWEDSTVENLSLKSDGGTSLAAMVNIDGSNQNVTGVKFAGITGFANGGAGSNTGTLFKVTSGGTAFVNGTIADVNMRQVDTIFDIQTTGGECLIENINVNTYNTAYANITDNLQFGENVPPLASGTFNISGGSGAGVKTADVTGVTTDQFRQLRVEQWVTSGPTATYATRSLPETDEWDNGNSRRDVTVREELVTDPGSGTITISYEIMPGAA